MRHTLCDNGVLQLLLVVTCWIRAVSCKRTFSPQAQHVIEWVQIT